MEESVSQKVLVIVREEVVEPSVLKQPTFKILVESKHWEEIPMAQEEPVVAVELHSSLQVL